MSAHALWLKINLQGNDRDQMMLKEIFQLTVH